MMDWYVDLWRRLILFLFDRSGMDYFFFVFVAAVNIAGMFFIGVFWHWIDAEWFPLAGGWHWWLAYGVSALVGVIGWKSWAFYKRHWA